MQFAADSPFRLFGSRPQRPWGLGLWRYQEKNQNSPVIVHLWLVGYIAVQLWLVVCVSVFLLLEGCVIVYLWLVGYVTVHLWSVSFVTVHLLLVGCVTVHLWLVAVLLSTCDWLALLPSTIALLSSTCDWSAVLLSSVQLLLIGSVTVHNSPVIVFLSLVSCVTMHLTIE